MKILYFHQYFKTPDVAGGTRSYAMARHLTEEGHKVTMVCLISDNAISITRNEDKKGTQRGSVEGIDMIEFDLEYSNKLSFTQRTLVFIKYSLRCIGLIFTEDYDLVFATSTPLTAGIPGIIMKITGKRKPFIFEVRDLWPELPREMGIIKNRFVLWMMDILESLSYNRADACIALSPGISEGIKKKLKKQKPVHMIPNGCDLELFKPGKTRKCIIQGVDEGDLVAIFTGAHGYANGLDSALDAARELMKTGHAGNIKLVFIGDGILKEHLLKRKSNEGLDNCIFLDPVPKKKLGEFFNAADIGLMLLSNVPAFYYGTSPNKFFDYISTGLPVFNNYPGWVADMIIEGNCGLVVRPDDPQAFASGLIHLSNNKHLLEFMGLNARKMAEKDFDRQILAENFKCVLEDTFSSFNSW